MALLLPKEENQSAIISTVSQTRLFFHGIDFYLKGLLTSKQWSFRLRYLWGIVSHVKNDMTLSLQGIILTELSANDKNICHHELENFPVFRDLVNEMEGHVPDVIFWCFLREYGSIWKICTTHWTNIFQWPMNEVTKPHTG